MSTTRCLVLGAGGFLGRNLCAQLKATGAEVTGYGRPSRWQYPAVTDRWIAGEFTDRDGLHAALAGQSHVFHLLGGSSPSAFTHDPAGEVAANVLPSLALLDACVAADVARVVFVSSGGTVYGPRAPVPTPETAATDPISAYGIGKLAVEKYLELYRHLHGLDYRILRVSNPFGPFQDPERGQGVIARMLHRVMHGRDIDIWGDGSIIRDFVFVGDVADAIHRAATHGGGERIFNIGSGIGRSLRQVIEDIANVAGAPARVNYSAARAADVPVSVLDCTRAAQELGWRAQTDWLDALARTRDWLAREYR